MDPLRLVRLPDLMALTSGRAEFVIGLVDGPVALDHPDLATGNVRTLAADSGACRDPGSAACRHGTFVAGVLAARRGSDAPAIAPGCTLLVRPLFLERGLPGEQPTATSDELAEAIMACVDAGARLVNMSVAVAGEPLGGHRALREVLDYAARRGVLVVAAAGNGRAIGSSVVTRHPWVIPVVGYDRVGQPLRGSNLGRSVGVGGLGGPGEGVVSLAPRGEPSGLEGTSTAAPFVAGAAALLWSLVPDASAAEIKHALVSAPVPRRRTVLPPLMDAWAAYEMLSDGPQRRVLP